MTIKTMAPHQSREAVRQYLTMIFSQEEFAPHEDEKTIDSFVEENNIFNNPQILVQTKNHYLGLLCNDFGSEYAEIAISIWDREFKFQSPTCLPEGLIANSAYSAANNVVKTFYERLKRVEDKL